MKPGHRNPICCGRLTTSSDLTSPCLTEMSPILPVIPTLIILVACLQPHQNLTSPTPSGFLQSSAKQRLCQNRSGCVGVYVGLGSHGESRAPGPAASFPSAQNHHITQHPSADTCSVLQRHGWLVSIHKMATSECQFVCKRHCSFCCRWRDICDALGQVCCAAFVLCISKISTIHMLSRLCHRSQCCSLLFLIIT